MRHNHLLITLICVIFSLSFTGGILAGEDKEAGGGGGGLPAPPDAGEIIQVSPDMENPATTDTLASFERDAQQSVEPDAIPTVPAEIHGEDKKEVSHNQDTRDWYENMEGCAVDY